MEKYHGSNIYSTNHNKIDYSSCNLTFLFLTFCLPPIPRKISKTPTLKIFENFFVEFRSSSKLFNKGVNVAMNNKNIIPILIRAWVIEYCKHHQISYDSINDHWFNHLRFDELETPIDDESKYLIIDSYIKDYCLCHNAKYFQDSLVLKRLKEIMINNSQSQNENKVDFPILSGAGECIPLEITEEEKVTFELIRKTKRQKMKEIDCCKNAKYELFLTDEQVMVLMDDPIFYGLHQQHPSLYEYNNSLPHQCIARYENVFIYNKEYEADRKAGQILSKLRILKMWTEKSHIPEHVKNVFMFSDNSYVAIRMKRRNDLTRERLEELALEIKKNLIISVITHNRE